MDERIPGRGVIKRQLARIKYKRQKLIGTFLYALYMCFCWAYDFTCVYMRIFGLPCPGCGMTRAWRNVFRLNFKMAFLYHPLFWTVIPIYLYILFDGELFGRRWLDRTVMIALAAAFAALEVIRLANPGLRAILY